MSGPGTTLAARRCPWCGHRCHGATCEYCADLERKARAGLKTPKPRKRREPGFRATCGKCGELAARGAWSCRACGTALYLRAAAKQR